MQTPPANERCSARRCRGSLRDAENPLDYILAVAERLTKEKLLDFWLALERAHGPPGPVSSPVGAAPFFWAGEKRRLTWILNSTRNPPGYLTRSPY